MHASMVSRVNRWYDRFLIPYSGGNGSAVIDALSLLPNDYRYGSVYIRHWPAVAPNDSHMIHIMYGTTFDSNFLKVNVYDDIVRITYWSEHHGPIVLTGFYSGRRLGQIRGEIACILCGLAESTGTDAHIDGDHADPLV
jgi:hypothetical protein